MALVINTNVASLSAQNSMNKAQMQQNEAMERLTTGKRINTAADDAAGLSIANKMTSQVNGLNQAVRNANDGISMLQTAAGGLEESGNILQRMRELAVQSASGTYDETNRGAMNAEVEQLKQELDRISDTTTFNGQKILDGSQKDTSLQVGANANETISFDIDSTASDKLGGTGADIVGDLSNDGTNTLQTNLRGLAGDGTNSMYVNGQDVGDLSGLGATDSLQDALDIMNGNVTGVEFGAQVEFRAETAGDGIFEGTEGLLIKVAGLDIADGQVGTNTQDIRIQNTGSLQEVVDQINEKSGGLVDASLDDKGRLVIASDSASNIQLTASADVTVAAPAGNAALGADAVGMSTPAAGAVTQQAQLTMTAEAGTDAITVTFSDVSDADVVGVNTMREPGTITTTSGGLTTPAANQISQGDIMINGVELDEYENGYDYDGNGTADQESDIVAWINKHSDETGVVAALDDTDAAGTNELKLVSKDGSPISVDFAETLTTAERAAIEGSLGLHENNATASSKGSVADIDVSTTEGAQKAIATLDKAIEQVSSIQGELGAVNNRLDFTVSNLSNVSENASAAKSRIEDADFAAESANLSRSQVLQQASQAMLAQANSAPQQVMSLLQ